jgi:hypothetical protein
MPEVAISGRAPGAGLTSSPHAPGSGNLSQGPIGTPATALGITSNGSGGPGSDGSGGALPEGAPVERAGQGGAPVATGQQGTGPGKGEPFHRTVSNHTLLLGTATLLSTINPGGFGLGFALGTLMQAESEDDPRFALGVIGLVGTGAASMGKPRATTAEAGVDPVLDSSVLSPLLQGDAEAVAFAQANRGLLSVTRTGVREVLTRFPRSQVRDVLRRYNIPVLKQSAASVEAGAARSAAAAGARNVTNDLRIIGSTIDAGIPEVVTADVQFALRAAKNGLTVRFRVFDPTMGPVNRIIELGRAARRLDASVQAGNLTAAERALIQIQ